MEAIRQNVIIPFRMDCNPMKGLALINYEHAGDHAYKGLELQSFNDASYGVGYRVIAYRWDGYVDVYDDFGINHNDDDSFNVAGKGLGERILVAIERTRFERQGNNIVISFRFIDKFGRATSVRIQEMSDRKTRGINLLAPIGHSTEHPSYLPLFFLYEFDFVRKHKTVIDFTIGDREIAPDPFPLPLPKDSQRRYYSRYTTDCQIVEFAKAVTGVLKEWTPNAEGTVNTDGIEYQFDDNRLMGFHASGGTHPISVTFGRGLPDVRSIIEGAAQKGELQIVADKGTGSVFGIWTVAKKSGLVTLQLQPSEGWVPEPNSLLTKMMFGKRSIFCQWPKSYRYTQTINLLTLESTSNWERI